MLRFVRCHALLNVTYMHLLISSSILNTFSLYNEGISNLIFVNSFSLFFLERGWVESPSTLFLEMDIASTRLVPQVLFLFWSCNSFSFFFGFFSLSKLLPPFSLMWKTLSSWKPSKGDKKCKFDGRYSVPQTRCSLVLAHISLGSSLLLQLR